MYVCIDTPTYAQCLNRNAELGNFTNWHGATSIRTVTGINIDQMANGIVAPFHTVTAQGFDPIVGGSLYCGVLNEKILMRQEGRVLFG